MLIIALGLAVFMVTVGFNLLINGVVFVNRIVNPPAEQSKEQTPQEDFFGSINLDEPPSATNSAEIVISGNAQEFDTVEIYVNNSKKETIALKGSSFEEIVGPLKSGENAVYALAKTKDGKNSKKTDSYTVYYKREPLELSIETPTNDMTTRNQDLQLKGTVDAGSTMRVNNQPVVVTSAGTFDTTFRLKEGENTLTFHAEDIAGNIEEQEIKVRYERED